MSKIETPPAINQVLEKPEFRQLTEAVEQFAQEHQLDSSQKEGVYKALLAKDDWDFGVFQRELAAKGVQLLGSSLSQYLPLMGTPDGQAVQASSRAAVTDAAALTGKSRDQVMADVVKFAPCVIDGTRFEAGPMPDERITTLDRLGVKAGDNLTDHLTWTDQDLREQLIALVRTMKGNPENVEEGLLHNTIAVVAHTPAGRLAEAAESSAAVSQEVDAPSNEEIAQMRERLFGTDGPLAWLRQGGVEYSKANTMGSETHTFTDGEQKLEFYARKSGDMSAGSLGFVDLARLQVYVPRQLAVEMVHEMHEQLQQHEKLAPIALSGRDTWKDVQPRIQAFLDAPDNSPEIISLEIPLQILPSQESRGRERRDVGGTLARAIEQELMDAISQQSKGQYTPMHRQ